MKPALVLSFLLTLAMLANGCTNAPGATTPGKTLPAATAQGQKPATAQQPSTPNSASQTAKPQTSVPQSQAAQPAVNQPFVIVNRELSNLQLDNPNIPVYDLLSFKERRAQGMPTRLPDLKPYRQGKMAYLTFDDGPEGKNTPAILDILRDQGVKGTFYVVGTYCYIHPKVVLRMFAEGHAIGNHSYGHDYNKLYPYVGGFLEEMFSTERVLREIIGYRPLIIRAPGGKAGHFTSAFPPALKEAGLAAHDWNVCIDDAVHGHPTAADFVNKVATQTASGRNPAIVLMHCSYGKEETVKALPQIIQLLRERGYSFGVMTPMTPQPW